MIKKIILSFVIVGSFSLSLLSAQGTKEIESDNISTLIERNTESNQGKDIFGSIASQADESLTLEDMFKYALEDERLALSEYELIMSEFNVSRPFSNIIKAEISHEAAILNLYDIYGFEISDFNAEEHLEVVDSLAEIYNIGIEAEIANIAMYDNFLKYDLPDDVRSVFISLRNGSINHLSAFKKQSVKFN